MAVDLTENCIRLIEAVLGKRCEPFCAVPHERHWRQQWVRRHLPATVVLMPALARNLTR